MNNLQPAEEQLITGAAMGSFRIDGNPSVGDSLTYGITDTSGTVNATYTVTNADLAPRSVIVNPGEASPTFSIALNSSLAIVNAAASKAYSAVGVMPADLISPQYAPPYFAEVMVTGPATSTFTLSASRTGTTNLLVSAQGAQCPVVATIGGNQVFGYVALLDALAMSMAGADLSLTYEKADVVNFRPNEVAARRALYQEYCVMLSRDLGGKAYADRVSGGSLLGGGGGATA